MISLEKQYESLCSAIAAIENGAQSYNVDGQSVTKANLATCTAGRKLWKARSGRHKAEICAS